MEESKCMTCKNLFVASAQSMQGEQFSRATCLVDRKWFDLLWDWNRETNPIFTAEIQDASIPFIASCSHCKPRDNCKESK